MGESAKELASAHYLRTGGPTTSYFKCDRCERRLPDSQFSPWFRPPPGVFKAGHIALFPTCNRCKRQARNSLTDHPLYSPELDTILRNRARQIMGQADARGLQCGLSGNDLLRLYYRQEGRCAISGIRLSLKKGGTKRGERNPFSISVDRINSFGNYVVENVQLVALSVNLMKQDMTEDELLSLCEAIVAKRRRARAAVEDELLRAMESV